MLDCYAGPGLAKMTVRLCAPGFSDWWVSVDVFGWQPLEKEWGSVQGVTMEETFLTASIQALQGDISRAQKTAPLGAGASSKTLC